MPNKPSRPTDTERLNKLEAIQRFKQMDWYFNKKGEVQAGTEGQVAAYGVGYVVFRDLRAAIDATPFPKTKKTRASNAR